MEFNIQQSQKLQGLFIITPSISSDLRGNIWTSFYQQEIEKLLPNNLCFKHDKFSQSRQNVLRGIHGDTKSWKYVTCVYGSILQVVVDCRKESKTYLQYEKFIINKESQKLLLIPPNMGNAYYVLSHEAVYHYKYAYSGEYAEVNEQFTYAWNDERIAIDWGIKNPILSERDIIAKDSQC